MIRRLSFQKLLHRGVGEGATPFPGLLHFTLDPYLIMLSVKQGSIKYHSFSLWLGKICNIKAIKTVILKIHKWLNYLNLRKARLQL